MSKKLGVLILHGMGTQSPAFADPMMEELEKRIRKNGANPADISWEPIFLAGVLQKKEAKLWRDLSRNHDLDFSSLRKFILNAFGDAIAYQRVETKKRDDVYGQIHNVILDHVKALRRSLRAGLASGDRERPMVVMAHSLGSYMICNYIWDRQREVGKGQNSKFTGNDFLEMKTIAGIITFGCNIPLFSLAYTDLRCIEFPQKGLHKYFPPGTPKDTALRAAKWLNYYDKDDILGYPLRPLSQSFKDTVTQDIQINVGGLLSSWNPKSHTEYWTDNDFTKPVAKYLAGLLKIM